MTPIDNESDDRYSSMLIRIDELRKKVEGLEAEYETAAGDVHNRAADDLNFLHQARQEAERLLTVIRGSSLFGRYHSDADEHARSADRWRYASVGALILWMLAMAALLKFYSVSSLETGVIAIPFLVLFFYCSLESNAHRRREANRRRIALRMAAVEAYMAQRLGAADTRADAIKVMDDFVRQHFIRPELDETDVPYLGPGPKFSLLHITTRDSSTGSAAPSIGNSVPMTPTGAADAPGL